MLQSDTRPYVPPSERRMNIIPPKIINLHSIFSEGQPVHLVRPIEELLRRYPNLRSGDIFQPGLPGRDVRKAIYAVSISYDHTFVLDKLQCILVGNTLLGIDCQIKVP